MNFYRFILLLQIFSAVLSTTLCPEKKLQFCERLYKNSRNMFGTCRSLKILDNCKEKYASHCIQSKEYQRLSKLRERIGFMVCNCPEMMIKDFLSVFAESDMCRNLEVLRQVVAFFSVPSCMMNEHFLSAMDLRDELSAGCGKSGESNKRE